MAKKLTLFPLGDPDAFQDALNEDLDRALGDFLKEAPAFAVGEPYTDSLLCRPVGRMLISTANEAEAQEG